MVGRGGDFLAVTEIFFSGGEVFLESKLPEGVGNEVGYFEGVLWFEGGASFFPRVSGLVTGRKKGE